MKLKEGYMLMELAGKYMGIYTGTDPNALNGTIETNEIGAFIWDCLKEDRSKEELLKLILENYDVDEKTASDDLDEVINILTVNKVIENI